MSFEQRVSTSEIAETLEPIKRESINSTTTRLLKLKKPPNEFKITPDHEEKLHEIFNMFQIEVEQGTGRERISSKHLQVILSAMYMEPSKQELKDLMKKLNPDNPDYITLSDLARLVQVKMKDKSSTVELERAFQLIDKEEKGFVSIEDLRRISKDIGETISEEELQEMIEEADISNSGHVTREDFLNFMNKVQDTTLER